MTRPKSARLRCRVRVEAETRTSNGQGGYVTSWALFGKRWAQKIPLRGDEDPQAGGVRTISTARFVIHNMPGLTTQHRLVEANAGTIWNIRAVMDPDGMGDRLELTCESGVAT